jgi:hypothetical protein
MEDKKFSHNSSEYIEYINSSAWKTKRQEAFKYYGKICYACESNNVSLDVHHLTYANFDHEELSELVPLCRKCHELIHEEYNKLSFKTWAKLTQITLAHLIVALPGKELEGSKVKSFNTNYSKNKKVTKKSVLAYINSISKLPHRKTAINIAKGFDINLQYSNFSGKIPPQARNTVAKFWTEKKGIFYLQPKVIEMLPEFKEPVQAQPKNKKPNTVAPIHRVKEKKVIYNSKPQDSKLTEAIAASRLLSKQTKNFALELVFLHEQNDSLHVIPDQKPSSIVETEILQFWTKNEELGEYTLNTRGARMYGQSVTKHLTYWEEKQHIIRKENSRREAEKSSKKGKHIPKKKRKKKS